MRNSLLLLLALLAGVDAAGQRFAGRKRSDIIPLEGQAKRIGWFVGPGLTYTLPRFKSDEEEVFRTADSSYVTTYDPNGRLGFYLEAGASWYTRDPVIVDYLDLGLAYKNLRGAESFAGTFVRGDTAATLTGEGAFAERMLTLSFNANKFIHTRPYQFVQLSLGANADYRLGSDYAHTGDSLLNRHTFPPDLWTQLHFKLGYGFKLTGHLILIPALETPVFSIAPEDEGFGRMQWFSSRYRPIIFSLRFLFLRARDGWECPPVRNNEFEKHKVVNPEYKPR
jgi:hypothetical protein